MIKQNKLIAYLLYFLFNTGGLVKLSAPIEFRFNDSLKLQAHMPRPARSHVDILNWLARRNNFT